MTQYLASLISHQSAHHHASYSSRGIEHDVLLAAYSGGRATSADQYQQQSTARHDSHEQHTYWKEIAAIPSNDTLLNPSRSGLETTGTNYLRHAASQSRPSPLTRL